MLKETMWVMFKGNLWKYICMLFMWLAPVHGLILFILIAIGVDTYFGRKAARKKAVDAGKEPRLEVTSKKTRDGFLSKAGTYIGILILCLFLDKIMLNDLILYFFGAAFPIHFLITKGLGIILILIELDSLDEHYFTLKGKRLKDLIKSKISNIKKLIIGAKKFKDEIEEE